MRALLLLLWTLLALTAAIAVAQEKATPRRPVVLIPGFASTQLVAWRKHSCSHGGIQKNLYRDIKVGDRIWIDVARILAQGDCWVRCMKLHMENQTELDCKLRAGEGFSAITELDPGFLTGPLSVIWRGLVVDLIDHFHFEPDEIIVAPYDWRLPPSVLQERDNYFLSLKRKIENAMALHGEPNDGGVVVIAHSMGNNVFRYFLAWLKHEVGRNHWQEWIDKHISAYFAVGAPLLGSPEAMELLASGITMGLPLPQREVRKLVATFGAILSFMPIPSVPRTKHDSDVLISVRFSTASSSSTDNASMSPPETIERNYTTVDIASGALFRDMAVHDPIFGQLEALRKRFYVDDDILDAFSPWERPPIASVYAVYGTNMDTKYNYRYHDTDVAGHWYQFSLENEVGNEQVCSKTGDGTVPYHSLSWAHTWLGPGGTPVNVTVAPQSVYFSAQQTKSFQAIRQGAHHHADYVHAKKKHGVCKVNPQDAASSKDGGASSTTGSSFFGGIFGGKSTVDEVSFYESTRSDGGRTWTTSVWEVEGARHREILSNAAFLRELRTELRHVFQGLSGADKSARPPMLDSDCYWNYRQAKCEFPEFCQYRYVFGDVVLDQSCRLRVHPMIGTKDTTQKKLEGPEPPLLLSDGLRNAGLATSHACVETGTCGANGTPLSATLPYHPWHDEDRMLASMEEGRPGYCVVPCEYCRYPTSQRRSYAH